MSLDTSRRQFLQAGLALPAARHRDSPVSFTMPEQCCKCKKTVAPPPQAEFLRRFPRILY